MTSSDLGEHAIFVSELHKSYNDREAVRGISFEVRRGEVFALLGPNGAGKTTTLEILEGYRSRDSGVVEVLGDDPKRRSTQLRERVGIVLQNSGFYRALSVREAVTHWAALYPRPRDVDEVLELAGLTAAAKQRPRTLSGGQRRRLDFALALIGDPELIFLDEPTTGFDPAARRTAWQTVRSLCELGKTVLLTTHYLEEAQTLADRVAILKDGRILATGTPNNLTAASGNYLVTYRTLDGQSHNHSTDEPTRLLHQLTAAALHRGEILEDLAVTRPSLEDTYLELTTTVVENASNQNVAVREHAA